MKRVWVYDIETIVNSFMVVFIDLYSDENRVFIIDDYNDNLLDLINFLKELQDTESVLLGFNNIDFDAQILEFILEYYYKYKISAKLLYEIAQDIIDRKKRGEFNRYYRLSIKNIDIYKINHWDSKAKHTSLKWTQFTTDWKNVEEMPHSHDQPITSLEQRNEVLSYCVNDTLSTKSLYLYKDDKGEFPMLNLIKARQELSEEFGIDLTSASEPKIGKSILFHELIKDPTIIKYALKTGKTYRSSIKVSDIILPYINFKTPEFNQVYNWFNRMIIVPKDLDDDDDKKGPKFEHIYKNVKTVYALGGIHGCISPGVYEEDKDNIIYSVDVVSFYPRLAITNTWHPDHINKNSFCNTYEGIFNKRSTYPKGSTLNYFYKIVLNSVYGLSKNIHSFLYDPEFTMKITINGQLLLSMLYEELSTRIPNSQPLMQNTDGLEIMIPREYEKIADDICKEWETLTKLQLEKILYKKMIIADVNNYIAVYQDNKTKRKGRFEYENLPLHKNKSALIIPKAIYNYFINNISPEETLEQSTNIYDFVIGQRLVGDWYFKEVYIKKGIVTTIKHKKLLRYYNSKKGSKIYKNHIDGRSLQLESGDVKQTIFNKSIDKHIKDYDIDYIYYKKRIYEEINNIKNGKKINYEYNPQLTLF